MQNYEVDPISCFVTEDIPFTDTDLNLLQLPSLAWSNEDRRKKVGSTVVEKELCRNRGRVSSRITCDWAFTNRPENTDCLHLELSIIS